LSLETPPAGIQRKSPLETAVAFGTRELAGKVGGLGVLRGHPDCRMGDKVVVPGRIGALTEVGRDHDEAIAMGMPSTRAVRGCPVRAPVVVIIKTGSPVTQKVWPRPGFVSPGRGQIGISRER
jgi:hypothetical protein